MVNLITILSFNVKLSHAQFLYDLQAEVLRLPLKSRFATLSSIERESPLYFWGKGEVNQKLKKTQVDASTTQCTQVAGRKCSKSAISYTMYTLGLRLSYLRQLVN